MPNCEICGQPMPEGEGMFKYHGYSGPCPKAVAETDTAVDHDTGLVTTFSDPNSIEELTRQRDDMRKALEEARSQIEYLHEKFIVTGSGNAVIARIDSALSLNKEGK